MDSEARMKEQAEKLQAQIAYEKANQAKSTGAIGGCVTSEPMRYLLTDRLRSRLSRKRRDQSNIDQLNELITLLDRNPEVARILDLVDALGNDY